MTKHKFESGKDFVKPDISVQDVKESLRLMSESLNSAKNFEMPDLSALRTMSNYPAEDVKESFRLMSESLSSAKNFEMPDLSALRTMSNYPAEDIKESLRLMSESLSSAKNFEMPNLSALRTMSNYPAEDIKESLRLMSEALGSAKNFERSTSSQEEVVLSNEKLVQTKEYIDKEISRKMDEYVSSLEKKPTNIQEYLTQKKVLISVYFWLIALLLSPFQTLVEDKYKEIFYYFIENIGSVIKSDQKYIELYEKSYNSNYRVVTKSNLPVKRNKHNQSETLEYLQSKQIVEVIENKKDWSKILVTKSLNNTIEGWVYTRYLTTEIMIDKLNFETENAIEEAYAIQDGVIEAQVYDNVDDFMKDLRS